MEAPRIPSIFKGIRSNTRGSRLKPRYYDPEQEDLKKRIAFAQAEYAEYDSEEVSRDIRIQSMIDRKRKKTSTKRGAGTAQLIRLSVILILVLAFFYYLAFYYQDILFKYLNANPS